MSCTLHERHHAHHDHMGNVDELAELLEHVRLLGRDARGRHADEDREQDDGNRRRLARARHVEEGILGNERQDHGRQRHILRRRQFAF
jgi:beta-lactamase superfamily II metal-dependent hydrolase